MKNTYVWCAAFALMALAAAKADPESGKIEPGSLVGDMHPSWGIARRNAILGG